jgi:hypothetical protein
VAPRSSPTHQGWWHYEKPLQAPIRRGVLDLATARGAIFVKAFLSEALAAGVFQNINKFSHFAALLGLIAVGNSVFDAMRDVIAKDFLFDALERRLNG